MVLDQGVISILWMRNGLEILLELLLVPLRLPSAAE